MDDKIGAKLAELMWWSVKWVIAAFIIVAAIQIYARLDRHNLLVNAILNDFREASVARQMREKALQELPLPSDPVPTEDRKR